MISNLYPYINFNGNCEAALTFYQSCLGGEIKLLSVKDSPAAPQLPSEMHEKIMHGEIKFGNMMIMATDINDQRSQTGNAVSLFIHFTEEDELMRAFEALSAGGTITLAVAKQFWGATYGELTDKFGIKWRCNFHQM